jgi:hypothetical protein
MKSVIFTKRKVRRCVMKIRTKDYKQSELKRKIGNLSQLGGTRHYELSSGSSRGLRAVDFNTGTGFCFTVLPDRALDISLAHYKGINLVYQTPNGEVNPAYYDPSGMEWLRIFFGGLMTTCGLTYFGPPGKDGDEDLGLHGRCTATPARQVCDTSRWEANEYVMEVSGIMEECCLFGDKVRMVRNISSQIGKKSLVIKDRVENFGFNKAPFTILYHVNAGFPLLDDGAYLVISAVKAEPYDEHSKKGAGYAALINPRIADGLGLYLKFKTDTLPFLSEWKMMGEGDYVVGIEPCNVKIDNRAVLKKKKMLPYIEPGEVKNMYLEIGVLEGNKEIDEFTQKVNQTIK